jgi:hypothetical protein
VIKLPYSHVRRVPDGHALTLLVPDCERFVAELVVE